MNNLFPLLIITLIVAFVGPVAVDYIGGLTLDVASNTADQMKQVLK